MLSKKRSRTCLVASLSLAFLAFVCVVAAVGAGSVGAMGQAGPDLSLPERVFLGVYLSLRQRALDRPAGDPQAAAELDVDPGTDAGTVATELSGLGVLDDPELFLRYLRYRGLDTGIEAGRYQVEGSMTVRQLADLLQRATTSRYTISIPEGWRREQVAAALGELGLGFTAGDFLAATRAAPPSNSQAPSGTPTVEGFLFPDTYILDPRLRADEVLALMLENFDRRVDSDLREALAARGLTLFEAVTLASIVEREAIIPAERPLIAAVFLNRLDLDIPLQADPTVQFALGMQPDGEWWKAVLTADDLQIDSAYNTYRRASLPPGPIASPGLASLRAVAEAPPTSYLFFRAACDGSGEHRFATTFEEHVQNSCP